MIRDRVIFDLAGSLTPSSGQIPNFLRGSKAYAEYLVDGGLKLVEVSAHQPRFGNDGSLYLEPGVTNYVRNSTDLANTNIWVRGSHITVLPNVSMSMANTYIADRVTVTPGTGNIGRQTLRQEFVVPAGTNTFTFYLRLMGGSFGANDVMKLEGAVPGGLVTVPLAPIYNDNLRRYLPVNITTTVTGTGFAVVSLQLYIENTASFDFAGAAAGPTAFRTTFVDGLTASPARANETLEYENSPLDGLRSFSFYMSLLEWRGNGMIMDAGNVGLEIVNGLLQATVGGVVLTTDEELPAPSKVMLRVSQDNSNVKLFVDNVLLKSSAISNFTAAKAPLKFNPGGVRRMKSIFMMDSALSDGSPALNAQAGGEVSEIMNDDSILVRQSEGRGILSFPSIRVKPGARAAIRLPQTQHALGAVFDVTPRTDHKPQVDLIRVENIVDPDAAQQEWFSINGQPPVIVEVAKPTEADILMAFVSKLEGAQDEQIKDSPVRFTLADGEPGLIVTSTTPGDPFTVSVSHNLSITHLQPNLQATHSLYVNSPSDFRLGPARIIRGNADVTDVMVKSINTTTGEIRFQCLPVRHAAGIQNEDIIFQASWKTMVAPGNYHVGLHETHMNEVKLSDKAIDGFALENHYPVDVVVTPFVRITV